MTLLEKYPLAFEDEQGWIWTSADAARSADWTYEHGDAFLDGVLGYSWDDAHANFAEAEKFRRKREFWRTHPRLRDGYWFILSRYRFTALFCSTVWRDWYGRISWGTAWTIASDLWLQGPSSMSVFAKEKKS